MDNNRPITPPGPISTSHDTLEHAVTRALIPFGWAPGGYIFTCSDCPEGTYSGHGDKRSTRCKEHAIIAASQAAASVRKAYHDLQEAHQKRVENLIRYNSEQVIQRRNLNAHRMKLIGWALTACKQLRFYAHQHREKAAKLGLVAAEYEEMAKTGTSPRSQEWRDEEMKSLTKSKVNDDLAQEGEEAIIWESDPGSMGRP